MEQHDKQYRIKRKIVNDPVYGFIHFPATGVLDLVEHRWFQRLRRIKQLGLTELVYPGAQHTRFHHAIGATYLMGLAIDVLRQKSVEITNHEAESAYLAILLHDIGHGPFSHALEHHIVNVTHEDLSLEFMHQLNHELNGQLNTAIEIFTGTYPKKYLSQLVSGQLDVDRLDYLRRDSFFTGVSEGVVSSDRIIKMLEVVDDQLVVEKKGIYSIEKFLIARRLMYWQVYLHKTVHSAEHLLLSILQRAKQLAGQGVDLFASPSFAFFLYHNVTLNDFKDANYKFLGKTILEHFALLDDNDVMVSIKVWANHSDRVLSMLCRNLVERRLPRTIIGDKPFEQPMVDQLTQKTINLYQFEPDEAGYFVKTGTITNSAYNQENDKILIKEKDETVTEIVNVADMLNIRALSGTISKYYLSFPKEINLDQ
jgi:hypothetical protein